MKTCRTNQKAMLREKLRATSAYTKKLDELKINHQFHLLGAFEKQQTKAKTGREEEQLHMKST